MGCWNESCALSGIDLPPGAEIYVALLGNQRFGRDLEVIVPPIRGKYDDYGGIDLTESFDLFGLKAGENWRPVEDRRGFPVFLDAEIFDFLPQIEREFSRHGATIGDALQTQMTGAREVLTVLKGLDPKDNEWWKQYHQLDRYFGHNNEGIAGAQEHISKIMRGGSDEDMETFLKFWARAVTLKTAEFELRKKVVPDIRGPQHGGGPALISFYQKVLITAKQREDEDRADSWNFDEIEKEFPKTQWQTEVASGETELGFKDWLYSKRND